MKTYKNIAAILLPIVLVLVIVSYCIIRYTNNKPYKSDGEAFNQIEWTKMTPKERESYVDNKLSKEGLWQVYMMNAEMLDTLDWGEKEKEMINCYTSFIRNSKGLLTSWENDDCFSTYIGFCRDKARNELKWPFEFANKIFFNTTNSFSNDSLVKLRAEYKVSKN